MTTRTCILCKHLDWLPGDTGYSECTPGSDARISCKKGKFDEVMNWIDTIEEYRKAMLTANSCTHYEEINVPPVANGNFQIPS